MDKPIILYVLTAAAAALVVFSVIRLFRLRKCRKIKGVVVDETYETSSDSDGNISTSRFPIYEYEWQGETHRYRSHASGGKAIGVEVELYIDADGVIYEQRSAVFLLFFGIAWLGIMAVQFFLT